MSYCALIGPARLTRHQRALEFCSQCCQIGNIWHSYRRSDGYTVWILVWVVYIKRDCYELVQSGNPAIDSWYESLNGRKTNIWDDVSTWGGNKSAGTSFTCFIRCKRGQKWILSFRSYFLFVDRKKGRLVNQGTSLKLSFMSKHLVVFFFFLIGFIWFFCLSSAKCRD